MHGAPLGLLGQDAHKGRFQVDFGSLCAYFQVELGSRVSSVLDFDEMLMAAAHFEETEVDERLEMQLVDCRIDVDWDFHLELVIGVQHVAVDDFMSAFTVESDDNLLLEAGGQHHFSLIFLKAGGEEV